MANDSRGRVTGLYTATQAAAPMDSHRAVEVVEGTGILGDRYVTGLGHWSDPRWPDQQLTLLEHELVVELGLGDADMRRNIVTEGIDLGTLIGRDFRIGTARLRGVRVCDPCRYIETQTRAGLFRDLQGRGGLRAEVLESGRITTGDAIVLEA